MENSILINNHKEYKQKYMREYRLKKKQEKLDIEEAEKSTAIPSAITTHRDAVRTKQASMETAGPDKNTDKLHGVAEGSWAVPIKIKYIVFGNKSSDCKDVAPPDSEQGETAW